MADFSRDFWNNLALAQTNGSFLYPRADTAISYKISNDFVLRKIENTIVQLLDGIQKNKQPCLEFRSRSSWKNVEYIVGKGLQMKSDCVVSRINLCKTKSCNKFGLCFKIMSMIYRLLQSNQTATKRDLYYSDPKLFGSQATLDHLIDDIGCMLDVPRHMLNVVATSKGCIAGDIHFTCDDSEIINCSESASGVLVPAQVHSISNMMTKTAKFLLVVEKDATFQRLLSENLPFNLSCIMITGKGVPDVNTRLLTRILSDSLCIPVFGLFDADPHGIEIMCVYRFGSLSLAYDSASLAIKNMKWIGLLPTDIKRLNLPAHTLLPFGNRDEGKCSDLMRRPYMKYYPEILEQVKLMQAMKHKAEIQALSHISASYLSDVYLPSKIKHGEWV